MIKVGIFSEDEAYARAVSLGLSENREDIYVNILAKRGQLNEGGFDVKLELEEYCSLGEILKDYDAQLSAKARRTLPCSSSCRLIGVSSAYGGLGQSTVCRALGGLLSTAFQKRVMYIDFSGYSEGSMLNGGVYGGEEKDLSEMLYRICCEDKDPKVYGSSFLRDEYGLWELPQRCGFSPAAMLTEPEADGFVRKLACSGMFDSVVLDLDYKLSEQRFFARICEENVLLKPDFESAPLYDFLEGWLGAGAAKESRRRLHVVNLSELGRAVHPLDADIYSDLGALLLPLARDIAGRMIEL